MARRVSIACCCSARLTRVSQVARALSVLPFCHMPKGDMRPVRTHGLRLGSHACMRVLVYLRSPPNALGTSAVSRGYALPRPLPSCHLRRAHGRAMHMSSPPAGFALCGHLSLSQSCTHPSGRAPSCHLVVMPVVHVRVHSQSSCRRARRPAMCLISLRQATPPPPFVYELQ